MNIFLWVLQVLIAFHTATGAAWKFSNSEQTVPTLNTLPHGVWLGMGGIELVCALALILPALDKRAAKFVPFAAGYVVFEMLLFTAVHMASGSKDGGPVIYWLVVAAICGLLAYGRIALAPLRESSSDVGPAEAVERSA